MKKACVIGWPISHSRSPLIHNYWLGLHGIDGTYEKLAIEPSSLAPFIQRLAEDGYTGCNVTLPHKETAFALVEIADEATRRLGVVNTIYLRNGWTFGTSTDGEGFIANLLANSKSLTLKNSRAVLLGAGGAAMSVVGALLDHGVVEIAVANRTLERAVFLNKKFGPAIVPLDWNSRADALTDCSLLVNTTALGMTGQPSLDIDLHRLPSTAVVTDIVYTPLETPVLRQARARGNEVVGGLGMLLHQAVRGFELWFGTRPQVTSELYDLVARDIDPDYSAMIVVGLTGSIAMGKTATAQMFASLGIPVFDADAEVHRLYAKGGEAVAGIAGIVPEAVTSGAVDRAVLSKSLLGNPEALKKLEAIVHPLVRQREQAFLARCREENRAIAVLDIPLLFETGRDGQVDRVVVVTAPEDIQRQRALERPGMTGEKLASVLARQIPDVEKRARAHYIVDTSRGFDHARAQVAEIVAALRRENQRGPT